MATNLFQEGDSKLVTSDMYSYFLSRCSGDLAAFSLLEFVLYKQEHAVQQELEMFISYCTKR